MTGTGGRVTGRDSLREATIEVIYTRGRGAILERQDHRNPQPRINFSLQIQRHLSSQIIRKFASWQFRFLPPSFSKKYLGKRKQCSLSGPKRKQRIGNRLAPENWEYTHRQRLKGLNQQNFINIANKSLHGG